MLVFFIAITFFTVNFLQKENTNYQSKAQAVGNTYYVSTTGSNTNPGTSASPWLTIQKAADTMVAGDTVTVNAGTYNERVSVTRSGSSGNLITFRANGTVITKGFKILTNYNRVDGFEVSNTVGGSWADSPGIYVKGSNNEVINNYVHDVAKYGVFFDASPEDSPNTTNNTARNNRIAWAVEAGLRVMGVSNLIESNDISHTHQYQPGVTTNCSSCDADGIRFFGTGHTIRKNYVHDILLSDAGNVDPHIDSVQTWGPAYNILFEQNTFHNYDGMHGAMIEAANAPVRDLTFKNNVFMNGSTGYGPGLNVTGWNVGHTSGNLTSNITIVNNTFVRTNGPGQYGIRLQNGVQTATIQNNAFYDVGNSSYPYVSDTEGVVSGVTIGYNSISKSDGIAPAGGPNPNDLWMVDPKFVDRPAKNFHLLSTSPLINAGITLSSVTNDFDGDTRPQGSGYDIGMDEYVSVAPAFDYSLTNSGTITATQGASGSNTITATLSTGTTQSVSYTASGLPAGATASFSPTSCNPTCSTTLTINTTASTPTGNSTITVTGTPLSKTTSFILTVNAVAPTPYSTYLEAESGTLASPMTTGNDALASGGSYVYTTTDESGTGAYTFTVPSGSQGTYYIWGRVLSPTSGTDSFYVKMDSGTEDVYDTVCATATSTSWQWTKVNGRTGATTLCSVTGLNSDTRTFSLSAGSHTLTFRGRETNTKLDRLFITNQASAMPQDAPSPTPTPTPASDTTQPSVPTGLSATTVSSSQINLSWSASTDNVGVTGYRLERCQGSSCTNFVQIATPTGTSYSNTGLSRNKTYRYRVRAVDAAGNLSGYSAIASATTRFF